MKIESYQREKLNLYNENQINLAEHQENLIDFIGFPFKKENFFRQIALKKLQFSTTDRNRIYQAFTEQYSGIQTSEKVRTNIELLERENTFTITTGHQLTLFGGPAYFFYKIIHVLSLCNKLNESNPEYNFVPVFWMASEDHDKEEVAETSIFGKKFRWETNSTGATGQFPLNAEFDDCKAEFIRLFSAAEYSDIQQKLSNFTGATLVDGMFQFLHSIFQDYGLLILDPNKRSLKKVLIPVFEREINESVTFNAVTETNEALQVHGIKPQAQIQPINFFYLQEYKRSKVIKTETGFTINDKSFTREELLNEINQNPETLSPNVFLRPLYQELILPNLAYVGGPGELSYWIQLKGIFNAFSVPFPLLVNRVSIFQIDKQLQEKINRFNFSFLDFANYSKDELRKAFLLENKEKIDWSNTENSISLALQEASLIFETYAPSNMKILTSEWTNVQKSLDQLKQKLDKQLNIKHTISINQLEQIKEKLFPNGNHQERVYHFFHFCSNGSLNKIESLVNDINPFESSILVIRE
jgi:bacillithiol biosynthesis cysteine-adding enzyme BshC